MMLKLYRTALRRSKGLKWGAFMALAMGLLSVSVSAETNIYVGGSYDGYDSKSGRPGVGYPYVDNANGATNVSSQSAWLNGTLLATGSAPTFVYAYWGTADGGTGKTSWVSWTNFGVCAEMQLVTTNVTVSPYTNYYYRYYCTNTAGEDAWAFASSFFSTPGPPGVSLGFEASFSNATLYGSLTGANANVYIYWGQDTNAWGNTNDLGTVAAGQFWTPIPGLTNSTVYYGRCQATNTSGGAWSDTVAFTTRVPAAIFYGGSYDGYDQTNRLDVINPFAKGSILSFY